MSRQAHPRVNCCMPFCKRGSTKWPIPYEFLCGKHYKMGDKRLRRVRTNIKRRYGKTSNPRHDKARKLDHIIWERIKRQILERM